MPLNISIRTKKQLKFQLLMIFQHQQASAFQNANHIVTLMATTYRPEIALLANFVVAFVHPVIVALSKILYSSKKIALINIIIQKDQARKL